MVSNIIELAKLGHERAAELKASCGAVDVRSLAQLISDLATQLEVQFVRSTNMAVQLANAESKCRELAAENEKRNTHSEALAVDNAALREVVERMVNQFAMSGISPEEKSINPAKSLMFDAKSALFMPATDAYLAEVRASARNEGINYAASRLAAAFNHGFVDKPLAEVCDVVRMILDTKEELANSTLPAADGISGEYAEKFLAEFAAKLRKGAVL
ncbi:hypothetical protein KSH05_003689 [Salmonella enterica subsp. enterica serovar Anatum]|uniref:Eae-like domain protein n=1 Tax=Salmonella anatum TaxID=58712 RepID=A0A4Z9PUC6_SALAN|nr:hypothetical protein [Salmonella enterica]EDL5267274.1 hypothetical protein [Salmonella enterica subsp. enterica serovar Enteritidis]EJU8724355.1 hypothetical protein [Salmonella enterica subsp. enterica]HCM6296354.1 hypothetical protein [Salmonella enterica subsp. enterica serovar 3:e,h:1,6]AMY87431.1 hypothetical protein AW58_06765 [Salmonella enterica subsp. enterica serovar Anatum str. USDA-ARS-USMARC-1765]EAB0235940.1 hypothetical protein [Salmonella enterica subsp. enterica serovar An